jgi:hypothetical protein
VIVAGHSDRVDTPGLTPEQGRAQELEASQLRAGSAQAWFFSQLQSRLQAGGFTMPADIASLQNVDMIDIACGAADLVNLVPANEDERKQNRRVRFFGLAFGPPQ